MANTLHESGTPFANLKEDLKIHALPKFSCLNSMFSRDGDDEFGISFLKMNIQSCRFLYEPNDAHDTVAQVGYETHF